MFASVVTDDILGKSEAAIEVAEDACVPEEAKTSTILGVDVNMGMGWDMGSRPILIRLAFSDSFSQALARSCSA